MMSEAELGKRDQPVNEIESALSYIYLVLLVLGFPNMEKQEAPKSANPDNA